MKPHSAVVYSSSMLLDILLNTQTHSLGTSLSNHPSPGGLHHPSVHDIYEENFGFAEYEL